ncbi:Synembryn-A [Drechslerella dactyloides]|uniref:Synembryn-A n=1 Tax=Drechslerella dactyloides TaxID=74499 RepID=A0AAD6J0P3_DREDA|nr:Synembryn-A [Drechslerella dactyloides]
MVTPVQIEIHAGSLLAVNEEPGCLSEASVHSKRTQVAALMTRLRQDHDAAEPELSQQEQCAILAQLKVFGRTVAGSDAIYAPDGITLLCEIGLRADTPEPSREALRCVANAMLLDRTTTKAFTDGGYMQRASEAYKSESPDDEFLLGRILFLSTTHATDIDLIQTCVNEHKLAENAHAAIARHAAAYKAASTDSLTPVPQMQAMALPETLKLLFTLTSKLSDNDLFVKTIPHLLDILHTIPLQTPALQPPVTHIIDALSNIHLDNDAAKAAFFPSGEDADQTTHVSRVITVLDRATQAAAGSSSISRVADDFDDRGASTLKLLHDLYPLAPEPVQEFMRTSLLPSDTERNMPLGSQTSATLPARLLRLSSAPTASNTRSLLLTLLFTLSDSHAGKFIRNIGYGHASGYLMMRGIPIPEDVLAEAGYATDASGRQVNPITGQHLDDEDRNVRASGLEGLEGMTDEEKEREAERLFVLFERLNRTGVVSVENPLRQAVQEGRFEELQSSPDDSDDEDDGKA